MVRKDSFHAKTQASAAALIRWLGEEPEHILWSTLVGGGS